MDSKYELDGFFYPLKNGWTVYSKTGCKNCVLVKDILIKQNNLLVVNCDDFLNDEPTKKLFLKLIDNVSGKQPRTFPMVFYNNKFVGGYYEALDLVELQMELDEDF